VGKTALEPAERHDATTRHSLVIPIVFIKA